MLEQFLYEDGLIPDDKTLDYSGPNSLDAFLKEYDAEFYPDDELGDDFDDDDLGDDDYFGD